jgi:hypothetical protein
MATKTSHELTWEAIEQVLQKAIDAYTVEDALRYNSEILDLLAIEMMIIRNSSRSQKKQSLLREATRRAEHHRDIVDGLTDISETVSSYCSGAEGIPFKGFITPQSSEVLGQLRRER